MIKKLYPKIADKKNFSILTDVFTFEMDKKRDEGVCGILR